MNKIKIFAAVLISFLSLNLSAKDYKASLFGVKSDGLTLNTCSIQKAIDFISENGGGRLVFYVGRYLTGTIQLKSNVTIQLEEGAILVGTTSAYDYLEVGGRFSLICADNQENIGIIGKGVVEGQGAALLGSINTQIQKGYLQLPVAKVSPALVSFSGCSQVVFEQVNLWDACGNAVSLSGCKDADIANVSVKSISVEGSAGIVLSGCDGVKLSGSYFDTSGVCFNADAASKNISVADCKNKNGKPIR